MYLPKYVQQIQAQVDGRMRVQINNRQVRLSVASVSFDDSDGYVRVELIGYVTKVKKQAKNGR